MSGLKKKRNLSIIPWITLWLRLLHFIYYFYYCYFLHCWPPSIFSSHFLFFLEPQRGVVVLYEWGHSAIYRTFIVTAAGGQPPGQKYVNTLDASSFSAQLVSYWIASKSYLNIYFVKYIKFFHIETTILKSLIYFLHCSGNKTHHLHTRAFFISQSLTKGWKKCMI